MKIEIIGKTFKNNSNEEFVVIRKNGRSNSGHQLYEIFFPAKKFYKNAQKNKILKGAVAAVENVPQKDRLLYVLRSRWRMMIARCYNEKAKNYIRYGGAGVYVCERWRNSPENFIEDCLQFPNVSKVIEGYELDKDLRSFCNNKVYCPEQCSFAPKSINSFYGGEKSSYLLDGDTIFLTKKYLARHLGVNESTVSKWFRGEHSARSSRNFRFITQVNKFSIDVRVKWSEMFPDWIPPQNWLSDIDPFPNSEKTIWNQQHFNL